MASSRQPREKYGVKLSEDFGSKKTLGWLVPRSMAGQPSSVNQIGFDCGTHAVGVALSIPPGRSKCWFDHQARRSLYRKTHGLPALPSVIGVRTWFIRSASEA